MNSTWSQTFKTDVIDTSPKPVDPNIIQNTRRFSVDFFGITYGPH